MTDFIFENFARTTLAAAKDVTTGKPLSNAQVEQVIAYLKSPGSGPDAGTSYAQYLARQMQAHPAKLPAGMDYVGFSGTDSSGVSNFDNATSYTTANKGKAGIIGDTPWGKFINASSKDAGFNSIEGKFQQFMEAKGFEPRGANYQGALQDMMWNAGSPEYFENAIASRRPLVAFVENAPPGRGFSNFELTTALKHPDAVINGYPVSAFGKDPLAFASKSAAEFQQLEKTIAQSASVNSGRTVSLTEVRTELKLIEGYDAVGKTLFNKPLDAFKALSFEEMTATRSAWVASGAKVRVGPVTEAPEVVRTQPRPGTPRGPPVVEPPPLAGAKGATEAAPEVLAAKGLSPGSKLMLKGAGAAGVALLAYDFVATGHQVVKLRAQGNSTGAESAATHFVGRSAGGVLGGVLLGAGYGALAGSETGPGALVTGLIGGVAGAYFGEKWAQQKDVERVFTQTDKDGNQWTRDPNDPKGNWTRVAATQQLKPGDGTTPSDANPSFGNVRYIAGDVLANELNYKSANASYALGLANPSRPGNPYSLPPTAGDTRSLSGGGNWIRNPDNGQWSREIVDQYIEHGMKVTHVEAATPQRAAHLEQQSNLIIAQNAANTPAAIAARYQVAYNQFGWKDQGPVPEAIVKAAASMEMLQASDGNAYTRDANGQWSTPGLLYGTNVANKSISQELDATYRSQTAGLQDMSAIAAMALANPTLPSTTPMRDMIASAYSNAGIPRTDAQIDAATAAVVATHARTGLDKGGQPYSLMLQPDPKTGRVSADSAIVTMMDDGGDGVFSESSMVPKATTTIEEIRNAEKNLSAPAAPTATKSVLPADDAAPGKTGALAPGGASQLTRLPASDQALYAKMSGPPCEDVAAEYLLHGLKLAKFEGIAEASQLRGTCVRGSQMVIFGCIPGCRPEVDLSKPPPSAQESVDQILAFNRQREAPAIDDPQKVREGAQRIVQG